MTITISHAGFDKSLKINKKRKLFADFSINSEKKAYTTAV